MFNALFLFATVLVEIEITHSSIHCPRIGTGVNNKQIHQENSDLLIFAFHILSLARLSLFLAWELLNSESCLHSLGKAYFVCPSSLRQSIGILAFTTQYHHRSNIQLFKMLKTSLTAFAFAAAVSAQVACDPLTSATFAALEKPYLTVSIATCAAAPGLPTPTYSIDFTQETTLPVNWTLASYENVMYDPNLGAEFTFAKRYDAPYIWTDFYFLFGTVEIVAQAAPGQGIISSLVLISEDLDEIDWVSTINLLQVPHLLTIPGIFRHELWLILSRADPNQLLRQRHYWCL